jgi:ubiquinol-cytochrome c reductase cytochrome c subunit
MNPFRKKMTAIAIQGSAWVLLALLALAQGAEAATPKEGEEAYMKNGCWQCHGTLGQGGIAGLKLAPNPKPLAYFNAFIRNTVGPMPPYSEKILSGEDLAKIHAYLESIPASPDPKTLPLLQIK